jgi:hypothetical protein
MNGMTCGLRLNKKTSTRYNLRRKTVKLFCCVWIEKRIPDFKISLLLKYACPTQPEIATLHLRGKLGP